MRRNPALLFLLLLAAGTTTAGPLLVLLPENNNQSFGNKAAWLGDVNGDGHDDFAVMDPLQHATDYSGRVYVYFGGPAVDAQPDLVLQQNASGILRTIVNGPIDFNGDGYGDIVIGSPSYDTGTMSNNGAVFVYHGGPALDAVADLVIPGPWTNYAFGTAISRAGHFDPEDDYDDLAVTISTGGGWGPNPTAYVYRGGPTPPTEAYWGRSGGGSTSGFQYCLAYAGDRNGDGRGDIVFGRPYESALWFHDGVLTFAAEAGDLYAVHGGALREGYEILWDPLSGKSWLGSDTDGGFDFNGDGYDDVLATQPYLDKTALIFGRPTPRDFSVLHLAPGDDVAAVGDVNADGYGDVAIADSVGTVHVFWGGAEPDAEPDWTIPLEAGDQGASARVFRAGDVDSDGHDDVLVTLMRYTGYGYHVEKAYVYGGAGMTSGVPGAPGGQRMLAFTGASPNPFNPRTDLAYRVEQDARIMVRLFDVRGRLVRSLYDGQVDAGDHVVTWDGRDNGGRALPSGRYIVQVLGLGRAAEGSVTLLR